MRGMIVHCIRTSGVAVALALAAASPALGQDKAGAAPKVESKVLLENDKVQVIENRFKPGAENSNIPRTARVVRAITAGTLQLIYPDGKKETTEWKLGEVKFLPASQGQVPQYTAKNIGKNDLVLYIVVLK